MTTGADNVCDLIAWAELQLRPEPPWRVIRSERKLTKTLFEVEQAGRLLMGKVSETQARVGTFDMMNRVWDAGMRPPSPYRIAEPVAWLPERSLLILTKAPGRPIMELVRSNDPSAMEAVERAGGWIAAMQRLPIVLPSRDDLPRKLRQCEQELELPRATAMIEEALDELPHGAETPAHGDCHPFNLYAADDGSITAIDLDTLTMREPAFDVAWFVAHLAIMGFHTSRSFHSTAEYRRRFLRCAPQVDEQRLNLHIRIALLRSLHYDLCLLKVQDRSHVEPFLRAAEHGLES